MLVFLLFGCVALMLATFAASEESYTASSPSAISAFATGLSGFAAPALATRRAGTVGARVGGVLLLVPAVALQADAPPEVGSPEALEGWSVAAAAWILVLIGGCLAGGLAQRAVVALLRYLRGDDLRYPGD